MILRVYWKKFFLFFVIVSGFFERRSLEYRLIGEVFKCDNSSKYDINYLKSVFNENAQPRLKKINNKAVSFSHRKKFRHNNVENFEIYFKDNDWNICNE